MDWQDPKNADATQQLLEEMQSVAKIIYDNQEALLKRGESLDELAQKSRDLRSNSFNFYKKARANNQKPCCKRWFGCSLC